MIVLRMVMAQEYYSLSLHLSLASSTHRRDTRHVLLHVVEAVVALLILILPTKFYYNKYVVQISKSTLVIATIQDTC